jgi:hypothetical protein
MGLRSHVWRRRRLGARVCVCNNLWHLGLCREASRLCHTCAASSKVLVLWLPPRPKEYISLSVMTAGCLPDVGKKRREKDNR